MRKMKGASKSYGWFGQNQKGITHVLFSRVLLIVVVASEMG